MTMERLSTALADRYRVERELGRGGMASVYLAHDVRHDRKVAVKVLKPELAAVLGAERFVVEIKTTAALQHPHILPLFDSGTADGFLFYVMPFIDGETLRSKLDRETQLGIEEAVRITTNIADALDYAHRHGVIHRDIKPENVLLHDGRPMVADFGIALAVSAAAGGRMTETGLSLGTPHYMSPEQATAEKELTHRSDIYSLGCVLYEMLSGSPPHVGATAQQIVMKIVMDPVRPVTELRKSVPPNVAAAVGRAVEKLPADRFESAARFAEALGNPAFGGGTVALGRTSGPGVPRAAALAGRLPWAIAAMALALAAWGWVRRPAPPPPQPVLRIALRETEGTLAPAIPSVALAPGGDRIAFVALDSTRARWVYLRNLNQAEATPVPGSEGAFNPFFSPDGASIGYSQAGKLRVRPLAGGSATTLADWPIGSGATWGDDGSIVFGSAGSLYRVNAAGGPRETVLQVPQNGRTFAGRPSFLPGSRAVLVQWFDDNNTSVAVLRLGDSLPVPLIPGGMNPQYLDSGWLLYGTAEGNIFTVPFDAGTLRTTGPPVRLADRVAMTSNGITRFGVARTGALVYYMGAANNLRELAITDREGTARALPIGERYYRFPRFSPDGRYLAFHVEVRGSVLGDLWRYGLDGSGLLRLTSDSASGQPEWTPDQKGLIYLHQAAAGAPLGLYRILADGSGPPQPVLARPQSVFESRLTPDGRVLVFREDVSPTNRDILMMPVDSPAVVRPVAAGPFDEKGLALSPDGHWLAYVSNETGTDEVFIRRLQEGGSRWPVSQGGGREPRWARTGELFFRKGDSVMVSRVTLGGEPTTTAPRLLFRGTFISNPYEPLWDVSPDGQRFVFVRGPNRENPPIVLLLNWVDSLRAARR